VCPAVADLVWCGESAVAVSGVEVQVAGGGLSDQIGVAVAVKSPPARALTPPQPVRGYERLTVWCRCWCRGSGCGVGQPDNVGVAVASEVGGDQHPDAVPEVADFVWCPEFAVGGSG